MHKVYLVLFFIISFYFTLGSPMTAVQASSNFITDFYIWRHGETEANKEKLLSGGAPELISDIEYWSKMTSLNEQGKQQAAELGSLVVNKCALDVIYTSDLTRAYDTASAVVSAYKLAGRSIKLHTNMQLREILQGKYEMTPAKDRNEAGQQLLKTLLEKGEGVSYDKFAAWKLHPLASPDQVIGEECLVNDVVDVNKYLATKEVNPETPWQLFNRIMVELVKIANEHPQEKIGISTHGAVLATLIEGLNTEFTGTYLPTHYNGTEIKVRDKVIPAVVKVKNCALIHFQYDHDSKRLSLVHGLKWTMMDNR